MICIKFQQYRFVLKLAIQFYLFVILNIVNTYSYVCAIYIATCSSYQIGLKTAGYKLLG